MTDEPAPRPGPTRVDLLRQSLVIGATSFGGGLNAHVRTVFVSRRGWVTETEFLEALEVAQTLPGPNVVNLIVMLGRRLHGVVGGLIACAGLVLPAITANILLVAFVLSRPQGTPVVGLLAGLGAAAAGLSVANAAAMGRHHLRWPPDLLLAAVAVAAVVWWRPPLLVAILVFGGVGVLLHLVKARRAGSRHE